MCVFFCLFLHFVIKNKSVFCTLQYNSNIPTEEASIISPTLTRKETLILMFLLFCLFKGNKKGVAGGQGGARTWVRERQMKSGRQEHKTYLWQGCGGRGCCLFNHFFFSFSMRNTLYSHTWPLSPLPGRKRSHQCTGRCISCVCCGGGCSRYPVPLTPPGSCPGTLGGRPSPRFGTPRSLAVSGRNLGPVPLGRPPLWAWGGESG